MKPHEPQLAREHACKALHLRNLRASIADKSRFNCIDQRQQALIREQADALERYVKLLEQRMSLLKIPV